MFPAFIFNIPLFVKVPLIIVVVPVESDLFTTPFALLTKFEGPFEARFLLLDFHNPDIINPCTKTGCAWFIRGIDRKEIYSLLF